MTTVNPEIKINPEYDNLVPELSSTEYEILKQSIKDKGQQSLIYLDEYGNILDGYHRYRACLELGIEPKFELKRFANESEKKEFVIYMNLHRRQLNDFQKSDLGIKLEEIEGEKARLRQLSKLNYVKNNLSLGPNDYNDNEKGRTIDIVSKKIGLKPKTYQRAKTIIKYGSEEVKEKLRQGKSSIFKEYNKTRRDQKRQELISQMKSSESDSNIKKTLLDNCKLILGDFRKKGKEIEDNSIDLIFTDPPYAGQYLYLYEDLAELAVRVLKPGGSLVFLLGHIIEDKIRMIFHKYSIDNPDTNGRGLKFWCPFYVKHNGNHSKIHARNVFAEGKPMLWYVKGNRANDLVISNTIGDYIESTPPLKIEHEWQQSTTEAEYIIKNLTLENQTVLDPMMGTGTTGIAALKLNRKFMGIEKDKETFEMANAQIKNCYNLDND